MKKVTLKITGGESDKHAQFYNCGNEGDDLYDQATELMDGGDSSDIEGLIDESTQSVEFFIPGLNDYRIAVSVEDESGSSVFEDGEFKGATQSGFIVSDPRKWQFDASMGKGLTERIKALVDSQNDEIESAVTKWKDEHGDEPFDSEFVDDNLCDLADGVRELIVQAPFADAGYELNDDSPSMLFAVKCTDLCENGCLQCNIELADDEDFDPSKLKLLMSDYDGFYYECEDAALPVVVYGNKFYRLTRDWEDSRNDYFGFAKKDEGDSYFEFTGGDF